MLHRLPWGIVLQGIRWGIVGCWLGMRVGSPVAAEDWPHWRGPRGDNSWKAPPLPDRWPQNGPRRLWTTPIGGGYAGFAVVDDRLFGMDFTPTDAKKGVGHERVFCLDASTGKLLWEHRYAVRYGGLGGYNNGPRATPTVHEGLVYTLGAVGHCFCFEAATGKIVWSKDTVAQGAKVPEWGFAGSPLIDDDRVLYHVGFPDNGSLVAYDRRTGKEIWRSIEDPAGYGTPIRIQSPSGPQIVLWTPEFIRGIEPTTGKPLWKIPYKVTYGVSIVTPIFREGIVFVTGYWEGSKAIRLGRQPNSAELLWEDNRDLRGLMVPPLYRDGYVYTLDKTKGLTCFELKTGKKLWDDDNRSTPRGRNPHLAIVWTDDQGGVLILNAVGELIRARLDPRGYHEQTRTKVIDGKVWSHPAFAGNRMFLRNDGGEASASGGPFQIVALSLTD